MVEALYTLSSNIMPRLAERLAETAKGISVCHTAVDLSDRQRYKTK